MSDEEIFEWTAMLGRNEHTQASVIHDLLAHAIEDKMTQSDRTVCQRALTLLAVTKAA